LHNNNDTHKLTEYETGIILTQMGRYTEALDLFDRYLEKNPLVEKAWYYKGISLYNIGDFDNALKYFDKVIHINAKADYAYYHKGLLYEELGKNKSAKESFNIAVELNSDYIKQIPHNIYPIKIITDETSPKGFLDFRKYAKSLAQIIENSTPRFTVGIFGGWGTGKTTLMSLILEQFQENEKILPVWFDAWRYEREEYLAIIPFLRTMRLKLEEHSVSNSYEAHRWNSVKKGIERTINAFLKSTKLTIGAKEFLSAEIDFAEVLKYFTGDGSIGNDFKTIYYDIKGFLEHALDELREKDPSFRIVVFIDDLDRCRPEKALEVLESIKSFFDIEGIIYVIGMNDASIDALIEKKYGENARKKIKGSDYMKKIVQLPFQIPDWSESDILNFVNSIILYEVKDSIVGNDFRANMNLLVKSIEANPREVKRFVNQIILVKSVFDKPVDNLIVVQALRFNPEWRWFLDFITTIDNRKEFFKDYSLFEDDERTDKDSIKREIVDDYPSFKYILDKDPTFLEPYNPLRRFLDSGAFEKLQNINNMEEYRRALEVVSFETNPSRNSDHREFQPLPDPTGKYPYHLSLNEVLLDEKKISDIINSGVISFHTIGNTGGIKKPEPQERIARAMEKDFECYNNNEPKPSFLYLLGDIVYYNGASNLYLSQFYQPYSHYPAPIFAIPGNHDGDALTRPGDPVENEPSLTGFVTNFCARSQKITFSHSDRKPMIQPNVYWSLEAPFITIIGLYSNIPSKGEIDNNQLDWLINELKNAPANKSIILSVHHSPYSADKLDAGSKAIGNILDDAFMKSGCIADLVISSHVNNYQRFTRQIGERQIPYIIAGAGGYFNLHKMKTNLDGSSIKVPYKIPNSDLILEKYYDQSHGFLSLFVSSKSIVGRYFAIHRGQESQNIDNFELDLEKKIITKNLHHN
jgi:tetratricopeptide (TPR) repeat protein